MPKDAVRILVTGAAGNFPILLIFFNVVEKDLGRRKQHQNHSS
jgi:hypothetical protein